MLESKVKVRELHPMERRALLHMEEALCRRPLRDVTVVWVQDDGWNASVHVKDLTPSGD